MLDRRSRKEVPRILRAPLRRVNEGCCVLARQIRVLSRNLLGAPPSRVAHEIDVRVEEVEATFTVRRDPGHAPDPDVAILLERLVVKTTRLRANRSADLAPQRTVKAGAQARSGRERGRAPRRACKLGALCPAATRDTVGRLAPLHAREAQPLDGWVRRVEGHGLFGVGHAREQIGYARLYVKRCVA